MRLDKFLQVSRIVKRRPVANEICDRGRVLVNGQPAKAGKEIKVGDQLTISFSGDETVVYEVLLVPPGNVPKGKAETLYREIVERGKLT
jgi:ribosomal 50S subunit-recycling heat shock protein